MPIILGRSTRLESQHLGLEPRPLLLGKRIVFPRQQTLVEDVREGNDPALMGMGEDPRVDARPIMGRQECTFGSRPGGAVARH
jgi:hypothetical protein